MERKNTKDLEALFPLGSSITILPKQLADDNTGIVSGYKNKALMITYGGEEYRCTDPVLITCYGETTAWASRKTAKEFYIQGMLACEGSERERYTNIFLGLESGLITCSDE